MKRVSKKIDAPYFLSNVCINSSKGASSYNDLAARYYSLYDTSASKQAFWKKVNDPCVMFFQTILARIIKLKISDNEISKIKVHGNYKRILVQDSTIIKLPLKLFSEFSGASNQHSSVCNARIQGVYDLLSGCFVSFSIDPFRKNDLLAASEIELQEDDLVLRDRGYYLNDEIERHLENGADCIYRYKHKTIFIDPISGDPINLLEKLEKNKKLDIEVILNNSSKTKVRLVAIPVSEEVGNRRRMKAKKDTRKNMSYEALKLMSWTIFITTIPADKADFKKLFDIYRLRWRIEIIFKVWKSNMNFEKIHNVSKNQLQVILLSRFIMIVVCMHIIYYPYYLKIREEYDKYLSMMKLVNYLMLNPEMFNKILLSIQLGAEYDKSIILPLIKYCTYDQRKRLNYSQLFEMAFLS